MMGEQHVVTARVASHPILRGLMAFPIVCFSGALLSDIVYAETADMMWSDFSAWLLAFGILFGALAAIGVLVELFVRRRDPVRSLPWPLLIGGAIVLVLALFDNLIHTHDAWTSVVPNGLILSTAIVLAMLVTAALGTVRTVRTPMGARIAGARR